MFECWCQRVNYNNLERMMLILWDGVLIKKIKYFGNTGFINNKMLEGGGENNVHGHPVPFSMEWPSEKY